MRGMLCPYLEVEGVLTSDRYFVVDSAEALQKFGQDAWDRVVCVMTTGQAWQFKPYKWSDPKVLFHHGALCSFGFVLYVADCMRH